MNSISQTNLQSPTNNSQSPADKPSSSTNLHYQNMDPSCINLQSPQYNNNNSGAKDRVSTTRKANKFQPQARVPTSSGADKSLAQARVPKRNDSANINAQRFYQKEFQSPTILYQQLKEASSVRPDLNHPNTPVSPNNTRYGPNELVSAHFHNSNHSLPHALHQPHQSTTSSVHHHQLVQRRVHKQPHQDRQRLRHSYHFSGRRGEQNYLDYYEGQSTLV